MKKAFLILLLLVGVRLPCFSQINESDTSRIQLMVRTGGSYQDGNVELIRITSQLDFSAKIKDVFVFKTQNAHLYQVIFSNKADDDLASRNYLYFKPQAALYPYAIGFISTNFRRNIEWRTFGGLGLTYQLLAKPNQNIKVSGNILYEQSMYRIDRFNYAEFDGSEEIKALWFTVYVNGLHQLKESALRFYYEAYWQQSMEDRVNYRLHLTGGLDVKAFKQLSVQSRIIYAYENVISSGVKRNDLLWTWGLAYQYKSPK